MSGFLEISNLAFSYGRRKILSGLSFSVERDQTLSLLGPNGCGKTTLSKIALGLLRQSAGCVILDGCDISKMPRHEVARKISYVPQNCGHDVSYSVLDMVLMGRVPHSGSYSSYSNTDIAAAWNALERLELRELASSRFNELSGGQRKLVLIARALAQDATLCVMDEPESGLDYGNQLRLFKHLAELRKDGMAFMITTHHPDHALWLGGHVLMLRKDGCALAHGPACDCINPALLLELYDAQIEVGNIAGIPFCLPSFASWQNASI